MGELTPGSLVTAYAYHVGVNKPKYITYAAASIMMITGTGKYCQGGECTYSVLD